MRRFFFVVVANFVEKKRQNGLYFSFFGGKIEVSNHSFLKIGG
jgi:hypothetical protein